MSNCQKPVSSLAARAAGVDARLDAARRAGPYGLSASETLAIRVAGARSAADRAMADRVSALAVSGATIDPIDQGVAAAYDTIDAALVAGAYTGRNPSGVRARVAVRDTLLAIDVAREHTARAVAHNVTQAQRVGPGPRTGAPCDRPVYVPAGREGYGPAGSICVISDTIDSSPAAIHAATLARESASLVRDASATGAREAFAALAVSGASDAARASCESIQARAARIHALVTTGAFGPADPTSAIAAHCPDRKATAGRFTTALKASGLAARYADARDLSGALPVARMRVRPSAPARTPISAPRPIPADAMAIRMADARSAAVRDLARLLDVRATSSGVQRHSATTKARELIAAFAGDASIEAVCAAKGWAIR